MNHINNDADHILIRKSQNTLIVVGSGTILFSIWTAVKLLGTLFLLRDETIAAARKYIDANGVAASDTLIFHVLLAGTIICLLLFVGIRTYIGLAAVSEGRGRRRHRSYLILAVIMIIFNSLAAITIIISSNSQESLGAFTINTSLSSFVIELTSTVMLAGMVLSAVRLRRARRRVGQSTEQKEQE